MTDDVVLRQNLPTRVDGGRLIAYNIDPGTAIISADGDRTVVHPGDEVTVHGAVYRVTELVPHDDARPEHRPNGWITLSRTRG